MRIVGFNVLITALFLGVSLAMAQTAADRSEVERAVLDYVEGVYELKPELIERSVHPDLQKFGFARRSPSDDWRVIPMTYEQLVKLSETYYKKQGGAPADVFRFQELSDNDAYLAISPKWCMNCTC